MSQGGGLKKWGKPRSAQAASGDDSLITPKFSRNLLRPNSTSKAVGRDTPEILTLFPTKGVQFINKKEILLSLSSYLNINFSVIILLLTFYYT